MKWFAAAALIVAFHVAVNVADYLVFLQASDYDISIERIFRALWIGPVVRTAVLIPIVLIALVRPATRNGVTSRRTIVGIAVIVEIATRWGAEAFRNYVFGQPAMAVSLNLDFYALSVLIETVVWWFARVCATSALLWLVLGVETEAETAQDNIRTVDLTEAVRTLDRLNFWRATYRSGLAAYTIVPPLLAGAYLVLRYALGLNPLVPLAQEPWIVGAALAAPLVTVVYALLLTAVSWRWVCILFLFTTFPGIGLVSAFVRNTAENFYFSERAAFWLWITAIPVTMLMLVLFTALTLTRRSAFIEARGWIPPLKAFPSRLRMVVGMPAYVTGAGGGKFGITILFWLASFFYIFWQLVWLSIANNLPNITAIFLRHVENDDGDLVSKLVLFAVSGSLGLLIPILIAGGLARIGLALARWGRRQITKRYRAATETDARPPVLYLRAFKIDDRPIASIRHGILPRLITAPGAPATLDEIILDRISPYAPIVAIGKPKEPTPPFGAARIYVKGDDWQSVVRSLADAGQTVIMSLDASPGVRWEIDFLLNGPHAEKTLFLCNPFAASSERWALLRDNFPECTSQPTANREAIGLVKQNGVTTILVAPHAGREAYSCAIGWHLRAQGLLT